MKIALEAEHFTLLYRVRDKEYVEDPATDFIEFLRNKYRIDITAKNIEYNFGCEYWMECKEKDWAFFLLKWG